MKKPNPGGKTSVPARPKISVGHQVSGVSNAHRDERPARAVHATFLPGGRHVQLGNIKGFGGSGLK